MLEETTVPIFCAGDNNFVLPMAVMLHSLFINSSQTASYRVYIVSSGITPRNKRKLEDIVNKSHQNVEVIWKEADEYIDRIKNFVVQDRYPRTVYLRLFIPEIIDPEWEKVIYLDGDMVVEQDILKLWETDISDNILLAVNDLLWTTVSSQGAIPKTFHKLGLHPETPFFNSGMYLMNVTLYRESKIAEKACKYLKEYPEIINYVDQDALNAVVLGRWGLLDPKWNVQAITINEFGKHSSMSEKQLEEQRKDLLKNPYILHYNGDKKPWHLQGDKASLNRFLHYLKSSGWFTKSEYTNWYFKALIKYIKTELLTELRKYKYLLVKKLKRKSGCEFKCMMGC